MAEYTGPIPRYDITVVPADGNAYSIMGATLKALRRAGATPAETAEYTAQATSSTYDYLLQTTMRWVNLDTVDDTDEDDDS